MKNNKKYQNTLNAIYLQFVFEARFKTLNASFRHIFLS